MPDGIGFSVLNNVPALMAYADRNERYRFNNNTYREWYGVEPEAIFGKTIRAVVGEANYARLDGYIQRVLAGEAIIYEEELKTVGRPRYVQGSYSPDFAPDGSVRGFFILVLDISERRALELRLTESEARFSGAFQSAAIGMAIVSPEGRYLQVNAALCRMLGYTADEFRAMSFQDITHPDDLAGDLALSDATLDGRWSIYSVEKRYRHKNGSDVSTVLSVSLVRDEAGVPLYFVSQVQDITDRKLAEERLFREHELSEVTLRSIGDAVITTDVTGRITYLNPVAETLTGWSLDEGCGKNIDEVYRAISYDQGGLVLNPVTIAMEEDRVVWLGTNTTLRQRHGGEVPVEDSAAPIRDRSGAVVGAVLVFHDVTQQRALASQMAHMAHHDALTDLPNRTLFRDRLEQAVSQAQRTGGELAVLFGDLDRFKHVNDTLGHAVGDQVMVEAANRLKHCIGEGNTVSRWAGDEFGILLPRADTSATTVNDLAERIVSALAEPIHVEGYPDPVEIGISLGISLYPLDASDSDALMQSADVALYDVKRNGRGSYQFFSEAMNEGARERVGMEAILRQAIRNENLELQYQPRVRLSSGHVTSLEALVRLRHGGEQISPTRFIRIAEESGLISLVGHWVIESVCRQLRAWSGTGLRNLRVSINVSPMQARREDFSATLLAATRRHGICPSQIELEITESTLVEPKQRITANLSKLREAGFTVALDDFGTGYSSLSYLNRLPIDTLKIDRTFVTDSGSLEGGAVVAAIVALGKALGKGIVAEGVETQEQLDWLRTIGCDEVQGFLFAPPLEVRDLEGVLRAGGLLPRDT
ncbi:EAL and GGDEF domain-containing protein [Microvirga brassicacearum]|uniref:EAL domain-containing protein n=1 Tax=Microvirga brassicacearum TaxID=2580413 RepID=A0A5N3P9K1_9HYPH|nr:GGDEF and EAL domain-containing protein [Microvirga brassicacearum]KAB0266410.1 EAL domain-containing protein [Microvirga brassicacearum]